ncbi:hypothetical protein [Azospirillum soli]|uniref:hypothetical protein n=1 Tax=Azospirillum soli TaxID=1304799 RepID=UPI001AE68E77|nr:hypothetical protein [Azospirillum soli]MBP2314230.1 hypothetical protein [Azospirillum soli]
MNSVWRIPVILGALSLVGLSAAILGDGFWHWICWITLSIPLAVCAVKLWRQWPSSSPATPPA